MRRCLNQSCAGSEGGLHDRVEQSRFWALLLLSCVHSIIGTAAFTLACAQACKPLMSVISCYLFPLPHSLLLHPEPDGPGGGLTNYVDDGVLCVKPHKENIAVQLDTDALQVGVLCLSVPLSLQHTGSV